MGLLRWIRAAFASRKRVPQVDESSLSWERVHQAKENWLDQKRARQAEEDRLAQEWTRQALERTHQALERTHQALERTHQAEEDRLAHERVRQAEEDRLAQERTHQAEEDRLAQERVRQAEEDRLAQERVRQAEEDRLAQERMRQAEEDRLAQERVRQAEKDRLAQKRVRQAEEDRLAQERVRQAEEDRLAQERVRQAEEDRLAQKRVPLPNGQVNLDRAINENGEVTTAMEAVQKRQTGEYDGDYFHPDDHDVEVTLVHGPDVQAHFRLITDEAAGGGEVSEAHEACKQLFISSLEAERFAVEPELTLRNGAGQIIRRADVHAFKAARGKYAEKRMATEVQFSEITIAELEERSRDYAERQLALVWITPLPEDAPADYLQNGWREMPFRSLWRVAQLHSGRKHIWMYDRAARHLVKATIHKIPLNKRRSDGTPYVGYYKTIRNVSFEGPYAEDQLWFDVNHESGFDVSNTFAAARRTGRNVWLALTERDVVRIARKKDVTFSTTSDDVVRQFNDAENRISDYTERDD